MPSNTVIEIYMLAMIEFLVILLFITKLIENLIKHQQNELRRQDELLRQYRESEARDADTD